MLVTQPAHLIVVPLLREDDEKILARVEAAGRVCYQSQDKADQQTAGPFTRKLIKRGHHSVIEHGVVTVTFHCDRGVSHELVRHRLASYSQESTRYCRYGNNITVIAPWFVHDLAVRLRMEGHLYREEGFAHTDRPWFGLPFGRSCNVPRFDEQGVPPFFLSWLYATTAVEQTYLDMLDEGLAPQAARAVLPNCLATKIVMTANLREWRHVLKLRCSLAAHPDMRRLMIPLLMDMKERFPDFFFDFKVITRDGCASSYAVVEGDNG